VTNPGERPIQALAARGVQYVEVRCMDINPFLPLGLDLRTARFLDTFLLYCALEDSPKMSDHECSEITANLTLAVKGTEVAAILIEQPDGRIKVSFRSRGPVDCSALAGTFGGGGHKAAAGAILDGPFEAAHARVTATVDEAWAARAG